MDLTSRQLPWHFNDSDRSNGAGNKQQLQATEDGTASKQRFCWCSQARRLGHCGKQTCRYKRGSSNSKSSTIPPNLNASLGLLQSYGANQTMCRAASSSIRRNGGSCCRWPRVGCWSQCHTDTTLLLVPTTLARTHVATSPFRQTPYGWNQQQLYKLAAATSETPAAAANKQQLQHLRW